MTDKIEIELQLDDVTNKFLLQIKETTESVARVYQAIEMLEIDIHKPLPTDDFPILIDDKKSKPSIIEQKEITINWVLRKGFEDFTSGIILIFKEVYKNLKIYSFYKEHNGTKTREQIEAELNKINEDSEKFHIPNFIEKIGELIELPLPYKEEIISINKIRNCLVHRHGIVSEKDIKDSTDGKLHLKWISLQSYTIINGEKHIITYEMRKKEITVPNLYYERILNEKVFKLKEKISLSINEFNGIAATCAEFAYSLFGFMPRSEEKRDK